MRNFFSQSSECSEIKLKRKCLTIKPEISNLVALQGTEVEKLQNVSSVSQNIMPLRSNNYLENYTNYRPWISEMQLCI